MSRRALTAAALAIALLAALAEPALAEPAPAEAEIKSALRKAGRGNNLQTELPAPAEIKSALQKTERDKNLQTELPAPARPEPARAPKITWSLPPAAAKFIFWLSLTIAAAALFWALRNSRPSESPAPEKENKKEAAETVPARLKRARESADDLARRGLFAQALHVLLLQGVEEMRRRLAEPIAPALTSREILAGTALAPAAGAALADLIGRVELSYFGGRVPGPEEYAAGRNSYEALAGWLRAGAGP